MPVLPMRVHLRADALTGSMSEIRPVTMNMVSGNVSYEPVVARLLKIQVVKGDVLHQLHLIYS